MDQLMVIIPSIAHNMTLIKSFVTLLRLISNR